MKITAVTVIDIQTNRKKDRQTDRQRDRDRRAYAQINYSNAHASVRYTFMHYLKFFVTFQTFQAWQKHSEVGLANVH